MTRKLFLTSAGLPRETRDYFLSLLEAKPAQTKVCFIPTAAYPEVDKWFVQAALDELKEIGFPTFEVDLKDFPKDALYQKLLDCDVIYVNGGNTFYLLDCVRKSGFDQIIGNLLDKGKVYLGVSAGSILAGPNIEISGWKNFDKNFLGLTDLRGLNLVPFVPFVHYEPKYRQLIEVESSKANYPISVLTDKQAVLVNGNKFKIVGTGEKLFYNGFKESLKT